MAAGTNSSLTDKEILEITGAWRNCGIIKKQVEVTLPACLTMRSPSPPGDPRCGPSASKSSRSKTFGFSFWLTLLFRHSCSENFLLGECLPAFRTVFRNLMLSPELCSPVSINLKLPPDKKVGTPESLEPAMAKLGAGVDRPEINLLQSSLLGVCEQALAQDQHPVLGAIAATLEQDKVLLHLPATHGG